MLRRIFLLLKYASSPAAEILLALVDTGKEEGHIIVGIGGNSRKNLNETLKPKHTPFALINTVAQFNGDLEDAGCGAG
jgi:hypothetical protein